jgi:hypothetical protein
LFNGTMHLHFFVLVHYQSRKCICACWMWRQPP